MGWDGMVGIGWYWMGLGLDGIGLDGMGRDWMVLDGIGIGWDWDWIGMRKDELTCEYCLLESLRKLKYSYRVMAWLRTTYHTSLRNA
jgi:hypothetical protein